MKMDAIRTHELPIISESQKESAEKVKQWFFNRTVDVGLVGMADSQKTPGFYVNWTNFIGFLFIGCIIVGCFLYAMKVSSDAGYEKGKNEAERRAMDDRLKKAEEDARRAKEWGMVKKDREEQSEEHK